MIGSASEYICAARFLGGVSGGGGQICSALYFAEIANDNIRGKLSTTYILSRSIGTLLAYVLGIYMNYIQASIVYIAISLAFAISFIFVPATPQHLLRIGANDVRIPFNPCRIQLLSEIFFANRKRAKHSNFTRDARALIGRLIEIPILRMLFNDFKPFPKNRRRIPIYHGKI